MEGQVEIPMVNSPDKVNIPASTSNVTLFLHDMGQAGIQLKAKKQDNTVLSAAAGAVPVLFA